jgi:hypothetical protein
VSIIDRLSDLLASQPEAERIVMSPQRYAELAKTQFECIRSVYRPGTTLMFDGRPVHRYRPVGFCRNCGAPSEPVRCSYCRSPSEFVEIQ